MTNKDVNSRVEFLQAIKEKFNQFQLHYKKETEESERNYNAQKTEIESKLLRLSKEHEKEKQDNSFIKDVIDETISNYKSVSNYLFGLMIVSVIILVYFFYSEGFDINNFIIFISPEDWKEAQALKKPVYCFPNDDQELGSSLGLLYNWYAVQRISMNPPKGFRIPNSNDIIDLNHAILQTQDEFLEIDFAFQQKIPVAHRLPLATFADGTNDRCFWTSEQFGFYTAYSYRINWENKIARIRKIDKNAGYFIRCIQNS